MIYPSRTSLICSIVIGPSLKIFNSFETQSIIVLPFNVIVGGVVILLVVVTTFCLLVVVTFDLVVVFLVVTCVVVVGAETTVTFLEDSALLPALSLT